LVGLAPPLEAPPLALPAALPVPALLLLEPAVPLLEPAVPLLELPAVLVLEVPAVLVLEVPAVLVLEVPAVLVLLVSSPLSSEPPQATNRPTSTRGRPNWIGFIESPWGLWSG
jgi:hypothetical protein